MSENPTLLTLDPVARRPRNWLAACFAISGAFIAFACVASLLAAILLPSIYRGLEPYPQEQWCVRATRIGADFVCDWKPTVESKTLPTLNAPNPDIDPFSILTPSTATPEGESQSGGPVNVSQNSTPFPLQIENLSTATPLPSATPSPTLFIPTQTPTSLPPTITPIPLPSSYKLDLSRLTYQAQTWNNCGPATLSMGLSFYGYRNNQSVAARYLKPNGEDKNVSPYQMVNYVLQQSDVGVQAMYRLGGDMQLLKTLLANNFPVIIEKGYEVNDLGWMGHYLLLVGYDDDLQVFYSYDSYLGHGNSQGLTEAYSEVSHYWRHFNNTFIVLYDPPRIQQVMNLLGNRANWTSAAQHALEVASQEIDRVGDNWAWFNLGAAHTILGDYERAAIAFDQAFNLEMPFRTLWYLHTPYTAYYAVGRYQDVLAQANYTENNTVYVEETFYYRGAVLAVQGDTNRALEQFNLALNYNSNFTPARIAREALQNGTFSKEMVLEVGTSG